MGGKHLKRLRAEKSKIKLKQKKTLLKGQNVTDTSFKIKKIVTVEQLKKVDENEPVSSWNVPLKDLLIRLNHYNQTSRLNGLNGIKELVTNYPEILKGPSLRPTVVRVLELLSDPEHKIRATAINLLHLLFSHLSPDSIAPFHDILIVHLSCAMTHRDVSIQQDSIKFIDVILQHASEAVKKNFQNLLQHFIRIIKIYLYSRPAEVSLSKACNLEKSKTEMFLRFYRTLALVYSLPEEEEMSQGARVSSDEGRFSLRDNKHKKIPDMSSLFRKSRTEENGLAKSESAEFQLQVGLIIPLLFDTWAESSPNRQNDGFTREYALDQNAAELLYVILRILLLLCEKIMALKDANLEFWFISIYSGQFKKDFTTHFPYLPSFSTKNFGGNGDNTQNASFNACLMQNLIICHLYHYFKLRSKNNDQEAKIERYVTTALMMKNPQSVDILSKVLEAFFSAKSKKLNVVISTMVKAYDTTNSPELRRNLFKMLMQVALEDKHRGYLSNQNLARWLKGLPGLLLKFRVPSYVIESVLKLISRPEGAEVLREVETKTADIISHLPSVKIEGMEQLEGQKLIANILYRCGDKALEQTVKKGVLHKNFFPPDLRSYIIDIFSYRLGGQSDLKNS